MEKMEADEVGPVEYATPPVCEEIKRRIDKTAEFVLKNGEDFEQVILKKNADNIKFAFLDPEASSATAHAERKYYIWIKNMKRQRQEKHATEPPGMTAEELTRKRRREELKG